MRHDRRSDNLPLRQHGVTLIELIVAMVLIAVIVGVTIYFAYPVRQSVDITVRAELTDAADNALQRIGREVRAALPNSVRVAGGGHFLEFLPVRTAGRYRSDGGGAASGTDCPATADAAVPVSDKLSFGFTDTCFKSIGTIPNDTSITMDDFVVLNNYGAGFTGQDAYEAAGVNRRQLTASANEGTRQRIQIDSTVSFDAALHDSPGKRFFIVNGQPAGAAAEPQPVTYECDTTSRTLIRRWGYALSSSQPTSISTGSAALVAGNVESCSFDYVANAAPQVGLLTLRLALSKARSDGTMESVALYHAVHVSNVP